jgi:hypothetical protein
MINGDHGMNVYPLSNPDFRLVRGVQNNILFQVRNIDRKPIGLAPDDILTISIRDGDVLLMLRALVGAAKGVYQLTLQPGEIDQWPLGTLRWSVLNNRTIGTVMLWVDRSYTASGTLYVTEEPIPGPIATTISVPVANLTSDDLGWFYSAPLMGAIQDGFVGGMQTLQFDLSSFTGTLRIDATSVAQPAATDWVEVASHDVVAADSDEFDVLGDFMWLRTAVYPLSGLLNLIQYKR